MANPSSNLIFFSFLCITIKLLVGDIVDCSPSPNNAVDASRKRKPDSEEDDRSTVSPQGVGIRGMASSGISFYGSSQPVPKCMGQNMRLEKLIQVTEHCEKETGEGEDDTDMRSLCFTACMWKYLGLVGDDMMFTSDIDSMVIDTFPPIVHGQVMKAVRGCAKNTVLPLSKTDNCTSFGAVKGCILRNVQNICGGTS